MYGCDKSHLRQKDKLLIGPAGSAACLLTCVRSFPRLGPSSSLLPVCRGTRGRQPLPLLPKSLGQLPPATRGFPGEYYYLL